MNVQPYLEGLAQFDRRIEDALDAMTVSDVDEGVRALVDTLSLPKGDEALERVLAAHILRRLVSHDSAPTSDDAECPSCGAVASLAVIVDGQRLLGCTCCHTSWNFRRIGCPYCGNESPATVLQFEGDPDHRLDLCNHCQSYLKTFIGVRDWRPFLNDWTTLHLDLIGRERGYRRLGTTLYDL